MRPRKSRAFAYAPKRGNIRLQSARNVQKPKKYDLQARRTSGASTPAANANALLPKAEVHPRRNPNSHYRRIFTVPNAHNHRVQTLHHPQWNPGGGGRPAPAKDAPALLLLDDFQAAELHSSAKSLSSGQRHPSGSATTRRWFTFTTEDNPQRSLRRWQYLNVSRAARGKSIERARTFEGSLANLQASTGPASQVERQPHFTAPGGALSARSSFQGRQFSPPPPQEVAPTPRTLLPGRHSFVSPGRQTPRSRPTSRQGVPRNPRSTATVPYRPACA